MSVLIGPDPVFFLLLNASVIASFAILPALVLGYLTCWAKARRVGPVFSLGRLEAIEMDRAILLYGRVSDRLQEIQRACSQASAGLLARYQHRSRLKRQFANEQKDLREYAVHLRTTIVRLRGRPIERLKWWMHLASSQIACSCCILLYSALVFCLVALLDFPSRDSGWIHSTRLYLDSLAVWKPFDDGVFYANWFAAVLIPIVLPIFYSIRLAKLRTVHQLDLRELEAFSTTDPDNLVPYQHDGLENEDPTAWSSDTYEPPSESANQRTWCEVLGVSPSASIEEIKRAYKHLVKQNHPDRVQDMAPPFRTLAETETKALNAAYEEALLWAGRVEFDRV